nr:MAG TPA: hypothetical protein [Caudoviricetes sp.]
MPRGIAWRPYVPILRLERCLTLIYISKIKTD